MVAANDIQIKNLYVYFPLEQGYVRAVDGINITFHWGEMTAIIGESGCGKSILGQALLNILQDYVEQRGEIIYQNVDVINNSQAIAQFYGKEFGIVPQNPGEALHPSRKIGKQFNDILAALGQHDADDAIKKSWLHFFGLEAVDRVLQAYPHELSGGMQQRVLCAMSCCGQPKWILADEPTKGLDEQVCSVVYENLLKIKEQGQCGMMIITHDLNLARQVCDSIAVMYSGQIVEAGRQIFTQPLHPYTQAFLASLPENGFQTMAGSAPAPTDKLEGCKFAPRCPYCQQRCLEEIPPVYQVGQTQVRCFRYAQG